MARSLRTLGLSSHQMSLEGFAAPYDGMPQTRYQGSKRKLLPWLYSALQSMEFESCTDLFGGTGSVTHLLRHMGKRVRYNDILHCNSLIATALFSEGGVVLGRDDLLGLFDRKPEVHYKEHISCLYSGVYFQDNENVQLDILSQNIKALNSPLKRAEAYYCLFQAALSKRPYNLFHRANLDMRTREVARSFGNKTTWDRSFEEHMLQYLQELKAYKDRHAGCPVVVTRENAFDVVSDDDLVYIDTPYAKSKSVQETNYFSFYHFLDALCNYEMIPECAQKDYPHKPFYSPSMRWHLSKDLPSAFDALIQKFKRSIIVISYRSNGFPSIEAMKELMENHMSNVELHLSEAYKYVLSSADQGTQEALIIGHPRGS